MKTNNKTTAPTVNQIQQQRPSIPTTAQVLPGYIANSMNAGHNRTIACTPVMAGTKIYQYGTKFQLMLLTPKTVPFQKLFCKVACYWVPNSRVWKNWENFEAQIKNETQETIAEEPNFGGKDIAWYPDINTPEEVTLKTNTTAWRDSWISCYIPRVGLNVIENVDTDTQTYTKYIMPKMSALPARGRVAIFNDMERNKEYDQKLTEYINDDTVSNAEWTSYVAINEDSIRNMRAKRPNTYYSNYRTQYQGLEIPFDAGDLTDTTNNMVTWASWAAKIAEGRSQAESAQDNPWTKIAEIRGSQAALEGKVQKLSEKVLPLSFTPVTQDTYNVNETIDETFQVLGKQGAYSYTDIQLPLVAAWEPKESGHLHVIATVYAETMFETGFDRLYLNVAALDKYRPDLKDDKLDTLQTIETNGNLQYIEGANQNVGFKRRYNEYGKLPNLFAGDMTNRNWYQTIEETGTGISFDKTKQVIPQKTFTYFEEARDYYTKPDGTIVNKKPWKDYSDIMLNKNQAIMNAITYNADEESLALSGQNQIFLAGEHVMVAELPIDEAVINNFNNWGEQ